MEGKVKKNLAGNSKKKMAGNIQKNYEWGN